MRMFLGDLIRIVIIVGFIVFVAYAIPPAMEFMQYGIGISGMGGAPR